MAYTPAGSTEAPIVHVANFGCEAGDYPAEVAGNIALISRGERTFAAKATVAKVAGAAAAAAVVYNNAEGIVSGTLGEASDLYAPVVGMSHEFGQAIIAALEAGEVKATLEVEPSLRAESRTTSLQRPRSAITTMCWYCTWRTYRLGVGEPGHQ